MAKMLGNTPHGQHSVCKSWLCGRKPSEDVAYRRSQRAREEADVRAEVVEALHEVYGPTRLTSWLSLPAPVRRQWIVELGEDDD